MTNKILKPLLILMLIAVVSQAGAQDIIVVNPEMKKTVPYEFNSEWHYLSSDLYLFNGTKFQTTLNGIYSAIPKKKRAVTPNPENILITASIDGTALGKLSYPIFNFTVKSADGTMKTFTADSYEAIRLMDNLPLTSIGNSKIDCNINIDIITKATPNKIFDFVATQLKSISDFAAPLSAAKTLVGELGNLIFSKTNDKEYKFNSTIRLYEEEGFSKRVASVNVYSFIPSQKGSAGIDPEPLYKYIDENDNPKLDRDKIASLIKCTEYPFMVIVNYKSKYVSDPVIGDQTTSETVDARLAKVKKAYENSLLSAEIYTQELKLIDYLNDFVTLKSSINNYTLNTKNRITDDMRPMFLQIFENYMKLRATMKSRINEFGKNPVFQNEFLPTYQTIITNAEGYLDGDNNLKNIKNTALAIDESRDDHKNRTPEVNEKTLAVLHSIQFPENAGDNIFLAELRSLITTIENEQYTKVFATKINQLKTMRPSAEAASFCEKLKSDVNSTYCRLCREKANAVINDYMQRQEDENNRLAAQKLDATVSNARDQVFTILQKEKIIRRHFDNDFPDGMTEDVEYIKEDFDRLQNNRKKLQSALNNEYSGLNTTQINILAEDIEYQAQDLAKILERICKRMPELCNE
ncbi:MAG: hypothetical protein J6T96_08900 [Bacteroidales bacterium]|nr:hypothetical protein [Bacteroidales bacterium]